MNDTFFTQSLCDRCRKPHDGCFTMSRFNTDYLCMDCAIAEEFHPDYQRAVDTEIAEVRKGNHNYPGIGYPAKKGKRK